MSLAATRIYDTCTGHQGYPPRMAIQGSPDIFINGRNVHRESDRWATHCNNKSCHDGILLLGSATSFANGKRKSRVTDPISCGSRVATGSPDVFLD